MEHDLINFNFVCNNDSVVKQVLLKQISRSLLGFKKYGVTMDRSDLKFDDWLNHLQDELMDAVIYIEKIKQEKYI